MGMVHNAGAEPARGPTGIGDHPTGMSLVAGIMMALYARQQTGKGARVTTSLMANGVWANSSFIQAAHCGAAYPARRSRADCGNVLSNHYVSGDGKRFLLCALDVPKHWPALCRHRRPPRPARRPPLPHHCLPRRKRPAVDRRPGRGVPQARHERYRRGAQPQRHAFQPGIAAVGYRQRRPDAGRGAFPQNRRRRPAPLKTVAAPVVVEGAEKTPPRSAPGPGEHSREVLREIGYSEAEIDGLLDADVTSAPAH